MRLDFEKFGIEVNPTRRTSTNVKTFCPKCRDQRHDKRDKSLSVNLTTGAFNCHYCGFSGCAAVPDDQERREWMRAQPWFDRHPVRKETPAWNVPKQTGAPVSGKALAWFEGRGISAATLASMRVTEGEEWMPQKNGKANTVQFNYYLDNQLVNTKFRTGDKCFKFVKGARLVPYNIDAVKDTEECIITEGEMDCLTFVECGRRDCVSVPAGANSNLEWLDDFVTSHFANKKKIYIASDTDGKGVALAGELCRRLGAERCWVLDYDSGCKDANEQLQKGGAESVLACLDAARPQRVEGVYTLADFEKDLDAVYEHGLQKGATLGLDNLDRLVSFETKRLCVVTGVPGCGKSEFIDMMVERLNMRYGWRTAYFSPENAPLPIHAVKIIEKMTGKKCAAATLPEDEYREAKAHLQADFSFIDPESYTIDEILRCAESLVRSRGVKVLVIDPYNRVENEQAGGQSETLYISQLLDKVAKFARANDVLAVIMAHPTKMPKGEGGQTKVPTLYDIAGSANFFNKCDFGLVINRNDAMGNVEIRVEKVKFRHLGETGIARMAFDTENGRYAPWDGLRIDYDKTNHLRSRKAEKAEEEKKRDTINFEFVTDNSPVPF